MREEEARRWRLEAFLACFPRFAASSRFSDGDGEEGRCYDVHEEGVAEAADGAEIECQSVVGEVETAQDGIVGGGIRGCGELADGHFGGRH